MLSHTIEVSRPFEIVIQQVLELGEAWVEGAVRMSIGAGAAGVESPPWGRPLPVIRVRMGWPRREGAVFKLPMEWELTGRPSAPSCVVCSGHWRRSAAATASMPAWAGRASSRKRLPGRRLVNKHGKTTFWVG